MEKQIKTLDDVFNDPEFDKLVPLTPERSAFCWSVVSGEGSVSGSESTCTKAKKQVKKWFKFAKDHGEGIRSAEIVLRHWDAWYKGKPAPKPTEKSLWIM